MPAKSNVRKSTKKNGFRFRWWMGVGLVAVVALVGVLVIRFSRAGVGTTYTVHLGNKYYSPSGWSYSNSKLYDQGHEYIGDISSGTPSPYPTTFPPVKIWFFAGNSPSLGHTEKYGCLTTTNHKYVNKAEILGGTGPYLFVEKNKDFVCE